MKVVEGQVYQHNKSDILRVSVTEGGGCTIQRSSDNVPFKTCCSLPLPGGETDVKLDFRYEYFKVVNITGTVTATPTPEINSEYSPPAE